MKHIFRLFQKRKTFLLLSLACSLGMITVTIFWNQGLAEIINFMQSGAKLGSQQPIKLIFLLVLSMVIQGGVCLFSAYAAEYSAHDLRMRLAKSILTKPYICMVGESVGEQLSSQQNEMEEINQYISENLFSLFSDIINFICTLLFLLCQNAKLTLIYLAPVVGLAIYTTLSSRVIYGYSKREQEQIKKMNGITGVMLSLFPIIRIYEAEKLLRKNYSEQLTKWQGAAVAEERTKARLMSISGMLSSVPLLLLMFVGGNMVVKGEFTMGMLYVFINLSGNVSGIMMNMPGHLAALRRFCGNLERVWECI